jgi:hypothetical protein
MVQAEVRPKNYLASRHTFQDTHAWSTFYASLFYNFACDPALRRIHNPGASLDINLQTQDERHIAMMVRDSSPESTSRRLDPKVHGSSKSTQSRRSTAYTVPDTTKTHLRMSRSIAADGCPASSQTEAAHVSDTANDLPYQNLWK